jgi:putative inorganic carbon (hco3(-)) transporter
MQFILFLVMNAVILLRPEEVFPSIAGVRLYLITLVVCTVVSVPALMNYFHARPLRERPVLVCVLGFFGATIFSRLIRMDVAGAMTCFEVFGKDILFFLLLVATLNSASRLRTYLSVLALLLTAEVAIALLNHHNIYTLEGVALAPHREYRESGEVIEYNRLVGTGIFNDPNDLCLCIGPAAVICLLNATAPGNLLVRLLWLLPLPLLGHGLAETYSRGGLLGVAVGVAVFLYAKFGSVRMFPFVAVLLVGLMELAGGGRQSDFSLGAGDTSNQRMQLWLQGIQLLLTNPLALVAGIGYERYAEELGLVAHNSFVHAFVETGLPGGSFFLAAFVLSAWLIYRAAATERVKSHPELRVLTPCILALVVAYAGGAYSLSRQYIGPTYLTLGLASAYLDLAMGSEDTFFRRRLWKTIAVIGLVGFVVIWMMTRTLVQY